jgi:hypothetical protein
MNKRELIKQSLDVTNGFIFATDTSAKAVAPNIWDFRLRDYQEKMLVVTPLAEQFDFRGPGQDYKVTIDERPTVAVALEETANIAIKAFSVRQVTFIPLEYGDGYQLTRTEAVRAFFNVADRMTKKLAYSLFEKKDSLAVSTIQAVTNVIFANAKTTATDLASSDVLDYSTIIKAARNIENRYYVPDVLLVNYTQKAQLLDDEKVHLVDNFGTRKALQNGVIGELFGMLVVASHSIPTTTNVAYAMCLGRTRSGEKAFGYAIKRDPMIEQQYHARGRYWDIVAHEEYDFKVLHDGAIEKIGTYA